MIYRRRWYYAMIIFFSIVGIGCFYDVIPKRIELAALQETINQLTDELSQLTGMSNHSSPAKEEAVGAALISPKQMAALHALTRMAGLSIESVNVLGIRTLEPIILDIIHFTATGTFPQFVAFMLAVEKVAPFSVITDFSYQLIRANKFILTVEMLWGRENPVWETSQTDTMNKMTFHNPFCVSEKVLPTENPDELSHVFPIAQIKMLGFIMQNNHRVGIFLLPNDIMIDLEEGQTLGLEQSVIKKIYPHHVLFEIGDKKIQLWQGKGAAND